MLKFFGYFLLSLFCSLLAEAVQYVLAEPVAAQPISLPSPTTNAGKTDAEEILKGAISGSRFLVDSFNQDWQDLATGNNQVYIAVVKISLWIATVFIGFWAIGWYQDIMNGDSVKIINEAVYPLIVILMIGINNGALLANTSLLFRATSNYLNFQVLNVTRNHVRLDEAIRDVNLNQAFSIATREKIKECNKKSEAITDAQGNTTNPRQKCNDDTLNDAEKQANDYREKYHLPYLPDSWNPLDWVKSGANASVQTIAWGFLSTLETAFQFVLQACFILNAYIGPIFLVLSLLPLGSKPIYVWLRGWLSLGLTLISYSILVGMAASSIVNSPSTNPLFFQLVEAILSPIFAVAIGAGGGMALFSSFTSTARFLLRV